MSKIAVLIMLAISLGGCGVVDTMVDGAKHVTAVENDLQASIGLKPKVGFRWTNGRLESVTVIFPRLYDGKPLGELAAMVRGSVIREFKQTPKAIVLAFSLGSVASNQPLRQSD
jgi:hypothetical protein